MWALTLWNSSIFFAKIFHMPIRRNFPPSKFCAIRYTIHHDFNCHINERETPKTCLANHKGSISHHITPLVINSLGGGHTHTHSSILTSWTKAISRNQSRASQRPACAWFNKFKICENHLLPFQFLLNLEQVLDTISIKFNKILSIFERVIHDNMKFFLGIFYHTY